LAVGDVASAFKYPVVFAEDIVSAVDGAAAYNIVKIISASDSVDLFFRVYTVKVV